MDGWTTKQNKDKTGHESHITESPLCRVAIFLFAFPQHHRLDASCISKRVEAGTRSTFYEHLLTLAGIWISCLDQRPFYIYFLYILYSGAKALYKTWDFPLFGQKAS